MSAFSSTASGTPVSGPYTRAAGPAASSIAGPTFVGTSAAFIAVLRQVERLAPFEHTTILLEGESGTGKSYLARHLHLGSPRAQGPFHQVILSALDDNLAASDLFGHLSGAYTDARQSRLGHFASAQGGTLFLDEVGKATPAVQRKLLHAVEHHEVWPVGADRAIQLNVRLVAATNISLEDLVERGAFLPDLSARLTGFRVRLPSLRERREDIPALVRQFAAHRAGRCGYMQRVPDVADPLMDALQRADWPYNLRQLDTVVQRLLIEASGAPVVGLEHCVHDLVYLRDLTSRRDRDVSPEVVRELMVELQSATKVARRLGVSRWTIYRYLERADATG